MIKVENVFCSIVNAQKESKKRKGYLSFFLHLIFYF